MQPAADIDYKSLYEQKSAAYDSLQITVTELQRQLDQLKKMIFGSKHERFIPSEQNSSQLALGIQAESSATCNVVDAKRISYIKTNVAVEQRSLQHPGRMKLPESLRREQIIIEPAEDISLCRKMGEEITEVLEFRQHAGKRC